MNSNNDIWVFLSHSNKDFEKVRVVRNLLEEQNYKPIMFFLKALNDDDEIDSLIKREIDARQLFILCDSDNARKSKWVDEEVKYIINKGVVWEKINIDNDFNNIRKQLCRFKSRNRIYINSTIDDGYVVNKIVRDNVGVRNDKLIKDYSKIGDVDALKTLCTYTYSFINSVNEYRTYQECFTHSNADNIAGMMYAISSTIAYLKY